jgi:hypothetical protein
VSIILFLIHGLIRCFFTHHLRGKSEFFCTILVKKNKEFNWHENFNNGPIY